MKKAGRNKNSIKRDIDILAVFVNCFIAGMFIILPLIFNDYYFNMLVTKYTTVLVLSFALIIFSLAIILVEGRQKKLWDKQTGKINLNLTDTDICFLVFILSAIVGTLLAFPYIEQAFLGYEGRYNGLVIFLLYTAAYFIVSRNFEFNKKVFDYLLITGTLVCLFGITDYFNLNIMGFKNNMKPEQLNVFSSSIGNINSYTGYIAYILSVSGILYICTPIKRNRAGKRENKLEAAKYYIIMLISFFAITMGNSDNGYLTLGAFFAFSPLFVWKNISGLRRYFVALSSYMITVQIIAFINKNMGDKVVGISGLYDFIAGFKYLPHIIIIMCMLTAFLFVCEYVLKVKESKLYNILRIGWGVLIILGILGVIYLIYKVNTLSGVPEGGIYTYLVFNDSWGTYRGYIWRAAIEEYFGLSPLRKLFGTGPDTFGIYMTNLRYKDMVRITGQYFDSAHNEYIQYLFTHGVIGLVSYLGIISTAIFGGIKLLKKLADDEDISRYIIASIMLLVCYSMQASVNLSVPTMSPIFFVFIMILSGIVRSKERINV